MKFIEVKIKAYLRILLILYPDHSITSFTLFTRCFENTDKLSFFGGITIKYCKTLRSGNEIPHNDIVIPTWYRSFFNGFVFRFIRLILPLTVFLMLVSLFQVGAMKLVHWMNAIGRVDLTTNQISALCSVKQSDGLWCLQEEMRALECTTTSISYKIPIKHS